MAEESGRDHAALLCDTNVLVRILTDDPPGQAAAASAVLDSPDVRVVVTDVVVAELCYVLTSFYGLSAAAAADRILRVVALPTVHVSDEDVLTDALHLWSAQRLGFPDAYLAALNRRTVGTAVLSFDRDLDRVEGVERMDPAQY